MDYAKRRASGIAGRAPRVDKHEGSECAVDGCASTCRAMRRYCHTHASKFYRTRSTLGRMPRAGELNPYRDRAAFALEAYGLALHPAVIAAEQTLSHMIANPGAMPERYAKHFRRLRDEGATGREMLLRILAVFGLRYVGLRDVFTDDAVFFACLGSRFLRTVPLGWYQTAGGKLEQVRLPGMDAETVGRALAERMGGFAVLFWNRVEREDATRTAEAMTIRQALEAHPL